MAGELVERYLQGIEIYGFGGSFGVETKGLRSHAVPTQTVGGARHDYRRKWQEAKEPLFNGRAQEAERPLLDALIGQLSLRGKLLTVIEGGAGSGEDAIRFVSSLPLSRVIAIDFAQEATVLARQNGEKHRHQFREGSDLIFATGDIRSYLQGVEIGRVDAFYANSLVHFFSNNERQALYQRLHEVQAPEGLIAVSFRTTSDVLYGRGRVIDEDERGVYEQDPEYPKTIRLFVKNEEALKREFDHAGYRVLEVFQWAVLEYDGIPGKNAHFVGFLAQKRGY